MKRVARLAVVGGALVAAAPAAAQTFTTPDPVLQRIWQEGMHNSQLEVLAQPLLDSIGPRLTGTPNLKAGNDWLVKTYAGWGIPARNEVYGTWKGWQQGYLHVDLLTPRVRTLEAYALAWSPGTNGPVTGDVVALPDVKSPAEFKAWLPQVRGKFVLVSFPQPTCRPDDDWERWALPADWSQMQAARDSARAAWEARLANTGVDGRQLPRVLEQAGARGIISNRWSAGWGVDKVFNAHAQTVPEIDVSCEDYGLLYRLQEHRQHPTLRVDAQARFLGDVPIANTIAEIKGTEKPDEYVVLSAHFDSWHSGSGATDNGTGTLTMLEAARILKKVYPRPKRTILIGHWAGEEQGLNGSRAFAHDHPEVVTGLQALFNQDNGTGRVRNMSGSGLVDAGQALARWLSRVPTELTDSLQLSFPGTPAGGGSDHASFVCASAPGFSLGSLPWNYWLYTWHTQRDTYDKVVFAEVRRNAVLTAMLAYLASEDPERVARAQRVMPSDRRTGQPMSWPACQDAARDFTQYTR
ncbi:MAG: M20/M25/M40 family metallo-hydrolase [Gemmatimonadetes bacterium]|nr:M20/M25/M40 family metallo-hydrolase [Gemmatimonadota bacterium]